MSTDAIDPQITDCRRVTITEARRRGLDAPAAEDVAQDICIRLWQLLAIEGKKIKHLAAWTRKATANLIIDRHRQERAAKYGGGLLESLTDYDDELNRCT